tara:strand:+ start:382 stop:630 length:249 start_codon:yes stop_codon:yes gene_type:complete
MGNNYDDEHYISKLREKRGDFNGVKEITVVESLAVGPENKDLLSPGNGEGLKRYQERHPGIKITQVRFKIIPGPFSEHSLKE